MLTRSSLRVALVIAAVAAVPATAGAATLTPTSPCYLLAGSAAQPIEATAAGLAASQNVSLRLTRKGITGGTSPAAAADAAGNLSLGIPSWFIALGSGPKKEVEGTLEAIDVATGTPIAGASASVALANLDYSVTGTGRLRSWKIQGLGALSGNATYYAHYLNGGKYRGRQKIGTGKGPCGYLSAKKPLTPFSKLGRYDVTIQASKKLNPDLPSFKGSVKVTKRYS